MVTFGPGGFIVDCYEKLLTNQRAKNGEGNDRRAAIMVIKR